METKVKSKARVHSSKPTKRRKRRRQRTHLFGMPIHRKAPKSTKKVIAGQPAKGQQGVALLMVLTLLVLVTTIVLDLQFDSRVQLQLAANSRAALQAEYLARSSLGFANLLLAMDLQFTKLKTGPMSKFLKMAGNEINMLLNRLRLWKMVPLNSDLLKQIASGAFGKERPKPGQAGQAGSQGKLYPFGQFRGRFSAVLQDESAKINLNKARTYQDQKALATKLAGLFMPRKYDPLFERTRENGGKISRADYVRALIDWVDSNNMVYKGADSEDSKYRYPENGYHSKNSYFFSLDELRLVYGVDDLFYQTFADNFTVYGPRNQINVNQAPEPVLVSLVLANNTLRQQERAILNGTPQFRAFITEMVRYRDMFGFSDSNNFLNWCKNPIPAPYVVNGQISNPPYAFPLPKIPLGRLNPADIITNANTFLIKAEGQVDAIKRRITAVIHVQARGKRDYYYWRLH